MQIQDAYLCKLLEDVTDLHVGVAHLHVKNFVSVHVDHVIKWQAAGVCVHIGLEFNLHLVGICNSRLELNYF